jgi:L-malate glycosyltransferase
LMVCSLKAYKGLYEFIQLAEDHQDYSFRLVLNAGQNEIDSFFTGQHFPQNLEIYPSQKNLHPFFQWADVIVNLSLPDGWIETFGLTIIEGMAYGLPAIVPPLGGILEVIEEGVTGYSVDPRDRKALNKKLIELMDKPTYFNTYSNATLKRLNIFKEKTMLEQINSIV